MKTNIGGIEIETKSDQEIQYDKDYSEFMASMYINKVRNDQLSIILEKFFKKELTDSKLRKALKLLCK